MHTAVICPAGGGFAFVPAADVVGAPGLPRFPYRCPHCDAIVESAADHPGLLTVLEHLRELGGDVRFASAPAAITVKEGGVRADVVDQAAGSTTTITAGYLVGADGAHSTVRVALGIGWRGTGRRRPAHRGPLARPRTARHRR